MTLYYILKAEFIDGRLMVSKSKVPFYRLSGIFPSLMSDVRILKNDLMGMESLAYLIVRGNEEWPKKLRKFSGKVNSLPDISKELIRGNMFCIWIEDAFGSF